jgi:hypothetical protein
MRNFVVAYAALVAFPVAGLLGVLRHGSTLTAPTSVGGVWTLQGDFGELAALPCGGYLVAAPKPTFTVSQSGQNFTVQTTGLSTENSGVISGTTLKALLLPSGTRPGETECSTDRRFSLVATVDPKVEPRSLVGTLSVSDCPACAPVALRAIREDGRNRGR